VLWPSAAGSPAEQAAIEEGRVVITYWDRHSGHEHEMRNDLIDEFNESQDAIFVRTIPVGFRSEKLLTAIASGAPPDICSLEGHWLQQLAPQGCFEPLDDWAERHPYIDLEDFFPHTWDAVTYKGRLYGIPTTTDTYCLMWNKTAFRQAGLDPERPPQTLEELEEFAAKLMVRDPSGGFEQIGFLPWLPWDLTMMWGGLFGGTWYDEERDRIVCGDDPHIIRMFEWMQRFSRATDAGADQPFAVDPQRYQAFANLGGAYASASNPFYTGKVAMLTEGEWQVTFTGKYAPNLDWGVAPIPQPAGAPPRSYSPTCVLDAIPTGARHSDEAKVFLDWFYSPRPNGGTSPASDYCKAIHNIPCRKWEALEDRFMDDPKFRVFVDELLEKPAVSWPVLETGQFLNDTVLQEREAVIFGRKSPAEAAAAIERIVNAELENRRRLLEKVRP
jgi:multiple sugar transport system substrate-binding protein